jgi:DNA-binding LacI/PurR family transcriptional regulator
VGFTRELARQTAGEVDGEEVQIRIADGDYREESGYDAVINLIKNDSSLPTAIFAENDLMAIGAIQALTENELEVPRHISVAGYDDSLRARYTSPSLTTIHQPAYEIGRQAAIRLLGGPESWRSSQKAERVPVSLVVRESTGPRREVCESI